MPGQRDREEDRMNQKRKMRKRNSYSRKGSEARRISLVLVMALLGLTCAGCRTSPAPASAKRATASAESRAAAAGSSGSGQPSGAAETRTDSEVQPGRKTGAEPMPELSGLTVSWTDSEIEEFQRFVDSVPTEYDFFGLYDIPDALKRYDALGQAPAADSSTFLRNGTLDKAALRASVDRNTEEFLAEKGGLKYFALPDDIYEESFDALTEGIELLLEIGYRLPQLDEKLGELKLMGCQGTGSAQMSFEGGLMKVVQKVIERTEERTPGSTGFRELMIHETMHLGQNYTVREKEALGFEYNMGPCYQWEAPKQDALWWPWYFEGAAEVLALARCGQEDPFTYKSYCMFMDGLTAAVLTDRDTDPGTVARLSLQTDLYKLLDLFSSGDEAGRQEAASMMCALEILLDQPDTFLQGARNVRSDFNSTVYFRQVRNLTGQTLTKTFYRRLSSRLSESCAVEDLFALISEFETEMMRITMLDNEDDSAQEFLQTYHTVQDAFFDGLARQLGTEKDALLQDFAAYHQNTEDVVISADFLPEESIDYLRRQSQKLRSSKSAALCTR